MNVFYLKVLDKSIDTTDFDELFSQTEIKVLKQTVKPLNPQENKLVDEALTGKQGQASQFKKVTVDYKDIYRLRPETWLNDEIINFYFELLAERSSTQKDLPSIHCFNTFFCSTLRDQGYAKIRRWTKRVSRNKPGFYGRQTDFLFGLGGYIFEGLDIYTN